MTWIEEISEHEEMENGQDRFRRGRARDIDPNGFGGADPTSGPSSGPTSGYGVRPGAMTNCPTDVTDPEGWEREHGKYQDQEPEEEYNPWREEDDEERRRLAVANSTGSQSLDDRIRYNADKKRRAADKRRAILDNMRRIIRDAMSARDTEVPGHNIGVTQSSALEPEAEPADRNAGDRRHMAQDASLGARSRMLNNMRRVTNTGLAYSPSNVGGSSPAFGSGSSASFQSRYPWASRVKIG
jgi:hypothetical protein